MKNIVRFDDFGVRWRGPLAARPAQSGTAFESVGESVGQRPAQLLSPLASPLASVGFRGNGRWQPWGRLVG